MDERRVVLYCPARGKDVVVTFRRTGGMNGLLPGVPGGWTMKGCSGKNDACFGRACPCAGAWWSVTLGLEIERSEQSDGVHPDIES